VLSVTVMPWVVDSIEESAWTGVPEAGGFSVYGQVIAPHIPIDSVPTSPVVESSRR
jgi:hypothetical protein